MTGNILIIVCAILGLSSSIWLNIHSNKINENSSLVDEQVEQSTQEQTNYYYTCSGNALKFDSISYINHQDLIKGGDGLVTFIVLLTTPKVIVLEDGLDRGEKNQVMLLEGSIESLCNTCNNEHFDRQIIVIEVEQTKDQSPFD